MLTNIEVGKLYETRYGIMVVEKIEEKKVHYRYLEDWMFAKASIHSAYEEWKEVNDKDTTWQTV